MCGCGCATKSEKVKERKHFGTVLKRRSRSSESVRGGRVSNKERERERGREKERKHVGTVLKRISRSSESMCVGGWVQQRERERELVFWYGIQKEITKK